MPGFLGLPYQRTDSYLGAGNCPDRIGRSTERNNRHQRFRADEFSTSSQCDVDREAGINYFGNGIGGVQRWDREYAADRRPDERSDRLWRLQRNRIDQKAERGPGWGLFFPHGS